MIEEIAKIIHDDISLKSTPVNDADRKLAKKILKYMAGKCLKECDDKTSKLKALFGSWEEKIL